MATVDDAVIVSREARRIEARTQRVERVGRERDMRLFRRPEIRLHAQMKLTVAEREPAAASRRHVGGLGQSGEPEQQPEEGADPRLAADGPGDLNLRQDRKSVREGKSGYVRV